MSSEYQIGTTLLTIAPLDELGLPPAPYPATFIEATEKYVDGTGRPRSDGFATAQWHFDILTLAQWHTLVSPFGANEGRQIYIRTRRDRSSDGSYAGQFATYTGYMRKPEPDDYDIAMGYFYREVTIVFENLQEVEVEV